MIEYLPLVTVSVYSLYVLVSELYDEFDMFVSGSHSPTPS
jgi:hypothetical protein